MAVHRPTRSDERRDKQTLGRLDRHRGQRIRSLPGRLQQLPQSGDPCRVVGYPRFANYNAIVVDDRNVVMVIGPVDPAGQAHSSPCHSRVDGTPGRWRPNGSALGTTPHEPSSSRRRQHPNSKKARGLTLTRTLTCATPKSITPTSPAGASLSMSESCSSGSKGVTCRRSRPTLAPLSI